MGHFLWPSAGGKHGAAGKQESDLGCAVYGGIEVPLKACDGCKAPREVLRQSRPGEYSPGTLKCKAPITINKVASSESYYIYSALSLNILFIYARTAASIKTRYTIWTQLNTAS